MKDAELKEVHFTSPLALMPKGKRSWDDGGGNGGNGKWAKVGPKGKGKGKKGGKGKGKGKGKMLASTPDGRQVCFNFKAGGCGNTSCSRVHMCRVQGCGATDHGASGHPWGAAGA